ncbi:hypothetical protein JZ751_020591 [Albula glossodonta]|uniref:Uncharacterized protein n=1 Tax=Albula glossodonta TaxID=121402 RepID=A0A8T2PNB2_9TELE|nr:hypothetical protein JZ751_020591 [Albula glossodonta]
MSGCRASQEELEDAQVEIALFYYAGHGYEYAGRNYLVAIDAPKPYLRENCVSVQRVMHSMQERCTALNVVLLDTCRKCEDAEAFEVQDGERSSGIFTKYLNKHILRPEKITHVLEQVSEDLGRDPVVTGKQVVEIRYTLKDPRSLADPVRSAGHTRELRLREFCWRQANELPERQRLVFPCGVEVELSFSALFSNIMVVFATVKTRSPQVLDHSLSLRSTPKSLTILVDLHYTDADSKLRKTESRQQDVGRPLMAHCELHSKQPADATVVRAGGADIPFLSMNKPATHRQQDRPFRHSTRKAETAWDCPARHTSAKNNEPEENDENESYPT